MNMLGMPESNLDRDLLQLPIEVGSFGTNPLADLIGLKGAQVRLSVGEIPGSALRLEFIEVRGVDRTPVRPRPQRPRRSTIAG